MQFDATVTFVEGDSLNSLEFACALERRLEIFLNRPPLCTKFLSNGYELALQPH